MTETIDIKQFINKEIECIYYEKENYLKSKIKPIWQKKILRQFLRFGLFIEEGPLRFSGNYYVQIYELKARNRFAKKIFLKRG